VSNALLIDKYKLDVEAERISAQIMEYGNYRNEAEGRKDRLYAKYKLLKNEKNLYYRKNPPPDTKITESVVDSLVETDKDVIQAHGDFLKAQEEFGAFDVAYTAVKDKSSKIRDLVTLHGMGYFATPDSFNRKKDKPDPVLMDD